MTTLMCAPAWRPLRTRRRLASRLRAPCCAAAALPPAPPGSVYAEPALYDLAFCRFCERDFGAEARWVLDQHAAHHPQRAAARSFLELACGPGRHAHAAAAAGVRSIGVDLSPEMCVYAATVQPGSGARFEAADMTRLRECGAVVSAAPFDVVTCLFSSFTHLLCAADALACLRGAAALLAPSGLVVLELEHPRRVFRDAWRAADGPDAWEVPSWDAFTPEGVAAAVSWGAPDDAWDPVALILYRTVSIDVYEAGAAAPRRAVRDVVPTRAYGLPELTLLSEAAGLRLLATHGALRQGVPLADPAAKRLVMLLCKA